MTQPTLDDIKRSIEHDAGCLAHEWRGDPECNCTRRDKIALLERLQEPTEAMLYAMRDVCEKEFGNAMFINGRILASLIKAGIAAAEDQE